MSRGACIKRACHTVEISYGSFQRWGSGIIHDLRKGSVRKVPRKLSQEEKDNFYQIANSEEYRDLTPGQIVPDLLTKGLYVGSERTLYRVLKEKKALVHKSESRKLQRKKQAT